MKRSIYLFEAAHKGNIGRGGYPQNQTMGKDYDYRASDSVHNLLPDQFADFEPNFHDIILMNGSALTDLISSAPITWYIKIVSDKLLTILTSFNLPPHRVYKVELVQKEQRIAGYNVLHILEPDHYLDEVDYPKSKIWIRELISKKPIELLKVKSGSELLAADKRAAALPETSLTWAEDLVMKDEFYQNYDLFSLPRLTFPLGFYVTENLKNKIESEKCTGVRLDCVSKNKDALVSYFGEHDRTFFPQA
jgi:hypothetical protein